SSGSAASLVAKRWKNGTRLRVRFLDGPPALQARVRDLAQQRTLYANLQFDFLDGDTGPADTRINLEKPAASSYLGTDARHVPQNQPTMSLQAITQEPNEAAVSALIVRQFGQVLAMVDATKSPASQIRWNREAVYRYYAARGMTREAVDQQLLQ